MRDPEAGLAFAGPPTRQRHTTMRGIVMLVLLVALWGIVMLKMVSHKAIGTSSISA